MDSLSIISVEEDGSVDLAANISHIISQIEEREHEIRHYLNEEQQINLTKITDECQTLYDAYADVHNEISTFEHQIRDETLKEISNATAELQKIHYDIEDVQFGLKIINQLIDCDDRLTAFNAAKSKSDLRESVALLASITDLFNNPVDGLDKLDLYKKIKVDLVASWDELMDELSDRWKRFIDRSEHTADDKKTVYIRINDADVDRRNELFEALVSSKQIHIEMKLFSAFLYKNILNPMIRHVAEIDATRTTLNITFKLQKRLKPAYEDVLKNLKVVFEFLYLNLNYEDDSGNNFIRMIGEAVCVDFSDDLIKDCLVHTIPNCISELQDYGKVTSQVEAFQKYLSSIKFFESENFSILQYANNIDVLFANKTSQYFLENARNIMKKDLGNIMSVGCDLETIKSERMHVDHNDTLRFLSESYQTSPFRFPRCAVSKSVQEILDLVVLMMEQAIEASDMCACRLFYTARNVFELYVAVVPLHHKKLIETMPQQVALFHNNCMYLAHHLLTLGPKWQKNLSGRDLTYSIIFCDQVKQLRDLATNTLLEHMRMQKETLLNIIRSSDLYYIATKDVLSENAEQAIRQCIRQLQVLKTVWTGILPYDIYHKLITCLANVFIEELISKVIVQEDITADVATQLTDLFKIVINRLPQIYNEDVVMDKCVGSWMKFNELIIILGGNLTKIDERWFNGNGPAAMQFKPDEIKRLIRALFQNTTFRANLLSKIK